jgi:hypothetical protein
MFLFNRKPRIQTAVDRRLEEKYQRRNELVQQEQSHNLQPSNQKDDYYQALAEHANACNNIAVYFNQQHRDVTGYEMSIRLKTPAGSDELEHPFRVNQGMIVQIQESPEVFLEGHVRTPEGLIKDIYDSSMPDRILRERFGQRDAIMVADLEEYERQRLASKKQYGPKTEVIYKDDVMDIPVAPPAGNTGRSL